MKLRIRNARPDAMTIFEVLAVIVCLFILVALLLPMLASTGRHRSRISCRSNLRQINIAFRIWEGDNGNEYPMAISVTNGGARELIQAGNLAKLLQVGASNEMSTTKIFVCPDDVARTFATNWNDLNGSHISYFVDADVRNETYPQMLLDGDDNLAIAGQPHTPGFVNLSSNTPVSWFGRRHGNWGNIGLADGSVSQTISSDLQQTFQGTGLATNRIVLP